MKKIAIITRTKDRPVFLRRALDSVAAQTFSDYVHVIVNDGGDRELVEDMVATLPPSQQLKTEVYHRAVSSGAPDTIFNESIDRVRSELVAIHDDDDTWHVEFLERTVAVLDEDSTVAGVTVRTDKVIETESGGELTRVKSIPYMPDVKAISLYRQCLDNQLTPISFLYRRSAYESVGKYDASLPVVGDWEFGLRLLAEYDVAYLDPGYALANYHHRKQGANSFSRHDHRTYITKVQNKYLREDLHGGGLGLGYIMSDLRYQQDFLATTVRKVMPKFAARIIQKRSR